MYVWEIDRNGNRDSRAQAHLEVKNLPDNVEDTRTPVQSLGQEDLLAKGMATHSNILA